MHRASSWFRPARWLGLCALAVALLATTASAAVIDLSLNVFYTNPGSASSGGTWEVVAKSDESGIAGLRVMLANVSTHSSTGPRGIVNGSDPAGFIPVGSVVHPLGFTEIVVGQAPLYPPQLAANEEQSVFYGVGTLTNGAPNYPGKPAGSNSIGPAFTTLTNVQNVPWATGDAFGDDAWNTAARLISGSFAPGLTPAFFQSQTHFSRGTTFTSLGTNKVYGDISGEIAANTIVRTNFSGMLLPDYNSNGRVDAADFVLWRKTLGQSGTGLAADGNGNNMIDQGDYDLWRMHFGQVAGAAAGLALGASAVLSSSGVPEPASGILLAIGAAFCCGPTRKRRSGMDPAAGRSGGR